MRSISSSESEEGEERAAGFVLFRTTQHDHRQYLLLRHCNDGHWAFPKGRLEAGENEFDAAVREISEETNIQRLRSIPGFRETSQYRLQRNGKQISKTVAYYLAETSQCDVSLSAEHMDFRWVGFDDAVALLTYDESRRILGEADRLLELDNHLREESDSR
jgi:bis(5'-nucleosidyl)-tetraphosphatase